ncbi:MAG: portal protein, partial [Exilibacterium sp.]
GHGEHLFPYTSVYVDLDHEHLIEEKGMAYKHYVIPRWFIPSDSQYAYSPAVVAGLPSARLYQDMTRVILTAGQKAVDPPMLAVAEALGSDIDIQAGGVTTVMAEYDKRLGDVLSPLSIDKSGLPLGMQMLDGVQAELAKALYIDKLNLPRGQEMTAYETSIRFQEYIRTILPLFEPKEAEMEAQVCQLTFDILFRHGAFGSIRDMPPSLQGADYQFKFISPLSKAIEEKKTNVFGQVVNVLSSAAQIEPLAVSNVDINKATRDAIVGAGADADWLIEEKQVAQAQAQAREQQSAQQQMAMTQQAKELISAEGK